MQVLYSAESYDPQTSVNHHLALAINEKAVAFAVHSDDGTLLVLGHFEFYIPLAEDETVFFDFIRAQDALKHKYKSTKVVLQGHKSTLVPTAVFNELYIESYLRHLYETEWNEVIKEVAVLADEAKIVFAAKEHLFYPARSKYYDADIEPHAANYLRLSAKHYPGKLNAFIEQGIMYLVYCQNNKPVYCNSFKYETADEVAYFIANYYQVFNVPPQTLPLLLHGNVPPQLADLLQGYVGKNDSQGPKNKVAAVPENFEFDFLIDFCH